MGRPKSYIPISPQAIHTDKSKPVALKREIAHENQLERNEEYLRYGEGDALPLKMASLVDQSPATKSCLKTKAKFIKGAGFTNKDLMKKVIDANGTTLWQFHSMLSDMLTWFDGFSVNFKFTGNKKISSSYLLSFESCRLGKPDKNGTIECIKYNPYFGTAEYKQDDTKSYPIFDIEKVKEQISDPKNIDPKTGKNIYPGQAYYYGKTTPLHRFNPVPDYWSGQFWINIDAKIQEFHSSNLDKNFLLSVIWNAIGDPSAPSKNPIYNRKEKGTDNVTRTINPKTVGEEFNEMLTNAFAGSSNGGAGIVFWSGTHDTATKVSAFPTNSQHDLFTVLQDLTTKNITIATQVPGILANISEGVNLGSDGNEMRAAIELMQSRVVEEQQILMDFYNDVLLPNLAEPTKERVEIVNFVPITVPVNMEDKFWEALTPDEKRKWMSKNVPGVELELTPATVQPVVDPANPDVQVAPPVETKVNENMKNLTGRQFQAVMRIVRNFNKGQLTFEQAKQMLKSGFAMSDEDVNTWLITPEEE